MVSFIQGATNGVDICANINHTMKLGSVNLVYTIKKQKKDNCWYHLVEQCRRWFQTINYMYVVVVRVRIRGFKLYLTKLLHTRRPIRTYRD